MVQHDSTQAKLLLEVQLAEKAALEGRAAAVKVEVEALKARHENQLKEKEALLVTLKMEAEQRDVDVKVARKAVMAATNRMKTATQRFVYP